MRGSLILYRKSDGPGCERSIPASAGQPDQNVNECSPQLRQVYPRECGAAIAASTIGLAYRCRGLSPRVRGSPTLPSWALRMASQTVYPRECGAASETDGQVAMTRAPGLSPRVRGSRGSGCVPSLVRGSIPASAGQPSPGRQYLRSDVVYPRECGAARAIFARRVARQSIGLSPRVRGSHDQRRGCSIADRSIPRVQGLSGAGGAVRGAERGLSTRERGSHTV